MSLQLQIESASRLTALYCVRLRNKRMIISHNALIHALNDYSAFGVVLFLLFFLQGIRCYI